MALIPPASAALVDARGLVARPWRPFLETVGRRLVAPGCAVHADDADAAFTGEGAAVVFLTGLASSRNITSDPAGVSAGFSRRFVNAAAADALIRDGDPAGTLLKTLAAGSWCDIVSDGEAFRLSAHGAL